MTRIPGSSGPLSPPVVYRVEYKRALFRARAEWASSETVLGTKGLDEVCILFVPTPYPQTVSIEDGCRDPQPTFFSILPPRDNETVFAAICTFHRFAIASFLPLNWIIAFRYKERRDREGGGQKRKFLSKKVQLTRFPVDLLTEKSFAAVQCEKNVENKFRVSWILVIGTR